MGVRGPQRQQVSLRRDGWRPPPIDPAMQELVKAIASNRGGTIAEHITKALILYATVEEADAAGLVE